VMSATIRARSKRKGLNGREAGYLGLTQKRARQISDFSLARCGCRVRNKRRCARRRDSGVGKRDETRPRCRSFFQNKSGFALDTGNGSNSDDTAWQSMEPGIEPAIVGPKLPAR
jgi:hypothetical protein